MPAYQWRCHVCGAANKPQTEVCAACESPAELTTVEIENRIAEREGKKAFFARPPNQGHRTLVTWVFILLFIFGGLQGFWVAAFGFGDLASHNPSFSNYASAFNWVDRLLWLVYSGLSISVGILMYQLKKAVIVLAWFYFLGSFLVLLIELIFRDAKRALFVDLGMWMILPSYGFWALTLWYLFWLKQQGRLRA